MATKYLFIDGLYRPWLQFRSLSGSSLQPKARPRARLVSRIIGMLLFLALLTQPLAAQPPTQIDIQRPPGSTRFGRVMTILSNGNIVVAGTIPGGRYGLDAIYLYNGVTGALISTLTEGPFDTYALGSGGVIELSNGNYLVVSLPWQWLVGAVTWGNGVTGVSGVVDSTNSLVGGRVGSGGVIVLSNGNYVVSSPEWWDNGLPTGTGAVTWGNGATGTSGKISSANSLVGSNEFSSDGVGSGGVKALSNGNYVVSSPNWYGEACCMGAVTWGNGATGTSGVVSSTNSLVGSKLADQVGGGGVTTLSNGNYVVSSPSWSNGMGAITWGSGVTGVSGVVDSTNSLVGSTADDPEYIATGDQVGGHGVITLSNGNYVVASPQWHNGGTANAGAVTWANGATGISGVVNSTNSLVGSTGGDRVGSSVTVLNNGNYVVSSPSWANGMGAVTWGNGATGISGLVNSTNSLVGSTPEDFVGGVTPLSNGNYVIYSPYWNNNVTTDVGAVTWGNGATGISGLVNSTNSLVGSTPDDRVGNSGVTPLSNGNYVVRSPSWANGMGAVTWGNGATGSSGLVNSTNSLVGSTPDDRVGESGVAPLGNGNYVVSSPSWSNGMGVAPLGNGNYVVSSPSWSNGMGAVTWGNGATGSSGVVNSTNSLVGSTPDDRVGESGVAPLGNGNYVVRSPSWANGMGAVTWGNGATGSSGVVNSTNSLVGSINQDLIDIRVTALSNGNYVIASPKWHNNMGAVTWGNGMMGVSGVVNSTNSLVGSTLDDQVGSVIELSNGHYVVVSPGWDNGPATDAGAVTWGNSMMGVSGVVNSTNSLVGSTPEDFVGGVTPLSNGNYVVVVPSWDNGVVKDIGAVTWGNGMIGISGVITDSNSLVGSTVGDFVGGENIGGYGNGGVTALLDGNYVVVSPSWDNGIIIDTGAVTWGNGASGVSGQINNSNSVLGATVYGGRELNFAYDAIRLQLVVGRPYDNIVTLFRSLPNTFPYKIFLSLVRK